MRMQQRVRLVDIARAAKVTVPTVSHVLAGRAKAKRISARLEKKIRGLAGRLGYRPNLLARSLVTQHSMTIGVLVANLGESFYPSVMSCLHQQLHAHGYLLLFSNHYWNSNLFLEEAQALQQRSVDALVLGPVPEIGRNLRAIQHLKAQCPVVAFEWTHPSLDSILNHSKTLGAAAADYLLRQRARRVLAVTSNETGDLMRTLPLAVKERLKWFQKRFASRAGNRVEIWAAANERDLVERIRKALALGRLAEFDGLFFAGTALAELCMNELLEAKPGLLQELVSIAISGNPPPFHLQRHMAVLYQNPCALGECLARTLLGRLKGERHRPTTIDIPAELIEYVQSA